ncbi:FxSxx-COOH system tetratricopeptide repeat protein [Streptomyces sp. NPDC003247]|uniref:FxSxx-COOH system tetratricopeptide repeat protein n=1 Tax=Streptomyces sp. NPDC003247 TaxID=3364677 RepID=UPI00368D37B1
MEVWDPGGGIAGSGYLVTDGLVLTAYHNVRHAGSVSGRAVEVRQLAPHGQRPTAWTAAEVLWPEEPPDLDRDPHTDAALLLITDPAWRPPAAAAPVRWGRLPAPGGVRTRVACVAVGFPEAEHRDGHRDTKQISGHIETLSGLKSGLITAHVDEVATPRATGGPSSWSGASGAALFCGDLLTGVLTTDRARNYPGDQLIAVPLTTLAARPGFATTVKAAGNSLALEDVTGATAADRPSAGPYDVDAPLGLHNLPDLPSPVFVGRKEALTALASAMEQDSKAITQTVQGLGGVGKTTLALHYAHTHRDAYQPVWWVRADTPEQIATDLAGLTTRIHGGATGRTTAEDAEWAVGWLQTHPGWLLVLDNADHPDATRHLLGQLRHVGRHLITSRFANGWPTTPLALPLLTPAASLDLLTRLTGLTDPGNQHHARLLAEELGHLPLALEQAGAFIAESRIPVSGYRDLLRRYPAETTSAAATDGDPQRTMARIWRITLDALHRTTPLAVDILRTAAWYAPEAIPRGVLAPLAGNPVDYAQSLGRLAAYGVIALDGDMLSVHRLVQTVARTPDPATAEEADPHRTHDAIAAACHQATVLLLTALPEQPQMNAAGWPAWRTLFPHAEALLAATAPLRDTGEIDVLLTQTAIYLESQGQIPQAITYGERSAATAIRLYGPDHPSTLTSRNNLASFYESAGDHRRAIPLYVEILSDRTRVLGAHHPQTLTSRNNLAYAYRVAGDLGRAVPLYEQTLTDAERILGEHHPHTLVGRNNLADAYQSAGKLSQAILLYERTLTDSRLILGKHHTSTITVRNNLAHAYAKAGDLERALLLGAQAFDDRRRVLGEDHPDTLSSQHNLASLYHAVGDLERALPMLERALSDHIRIMGEEHPHTLTCRGNLASTCEAAGDLERAVLLYEETYAGRVRVLGEDHPSTLASRDRLARARSAGT